MTSTTARAARAIGVTKAYGSGETRVLALDEVSVAFDAGRFTAIMGPSGSGKSTLMHCLAGLDTVSGGEVYIGDTRVTGLSDRKLTRLRRDKVGFIFQQFNLLPTLTAQENILLPLSIARRRPDAGWFDTVVATVGLPDRLAHRPTQLSGGQQQRVACARALVAHVGVRRHRYVGVGEDVGEQRVERAAERVGQHERARHEHHRQHDGDHRQCQPQLAAQQPLQSRP